RWLAAQPPSASAGDTAFLAHSRGRHGWPARSHLQADRLAVSLRAMVAELVLRIPQGLRRLLAAPRVRRGIPAVWAMERLSRVPGCSAIVRRTATATATDSDSDSDSDSARACLQQCRRA